MGGKDGEEKIEAWSIKLFVLKQLHCKVCWL